MSEEERLHALERDVGMLKDLFAELGARQMISDEKMNRFFEENPEFQEDEEGENDED